MGDAGYPDDPDPTGREEIELFRQLRFLADHWSRPAGRPAYYWYLTFEACEELHSLVRQAQKAISLPYYDLVSLSELHLTLDRAAFADDVHSDRLSAIETVASRACLNVEPFKISIGVLGGTRGAVGFTAFPTEQLRKLRDTFRAATLAICPHAPVTLARFYPHVTIAYANTDGVPAAEAIAAVDQINASLSPVDVTVNEGALVLLERRERSYAWRALSRIPLQGQTPIMPE